MVVLYAKHHDKTASEVSMVLVTEASVTNAVSLDKAEEFELEQPTANIGKRKKHKRMASLRCKICCMVHSWTFLNNQKIHFKCAEEIDVCANEKTVKMKIYAE
jgi:hypothetical protein